MTNKETIERNIGLTFDFVNYLIDNPDKTLNLPDNFKLEILEKDFHNLGKARNANDESEKIRKIVRVRNSFELTK